MKRILLSLFTAVVAIPAMAQLDRSVRPEPGPAREPEIAEFEEFELDNGIQLIVVENHKLPRVSMQVSLDIDPIYEGDKAGMISLTGDLLSEGTVNRTKEQLDEEVDFMGARLSTYSSGAFVSGLSKYDESLMGILSDVIMNPRFSEEAFEKLKQQNLSGLKANANDPGALMSDLWGGRIYGLDHAYGEILTEEKVENITLEDCKNYYNTYFKPNIAYIVIVGDIDPDDAEEMVEKYFGDWEMGEVPTHDVSVPEVPAATYVALLDRPASVQSEIRIGNRVVLPVGSEDLEAVRLANMILGGGSLGRLYLNIREDKSFTYGAYSSIGTNEHVSTFVASGAVRNEVTDSAIVEFLYEINRIRTELVSEKELQDAKNYLAGSFGRSLESAQTVANFGLNIKRYGLDEDYYNDYLQRLDAVTAEDVRAAAQKYFLAENLTIAIVGKASEIAPTLDKFGEVQRFDRFGMPAAATVAVPEGMTADDVMEKFYESIGGMEAVKAVENYTVTAEASIQGMTITLTETWMAPDMYKQESMSPMGGQELIVNGDDVRVMSGGQEVPITPEQAEESKADASIFEFEDHSAVKKVLQPNLVEVNGQQAYAVEFHDGDDVTTHYFSAETGYRIRSSSLAMDQTGQEVVRDVDYSNFTSVNGITMPQSIMAPLGPMVVEFKVTNMEINSENIDASMF